MRDITKFIVTEFVQGRERRRNNSYTNGKELFLHNKLIAWRDPDGNYRVTCAGYATMTTKERLNGLCEMLNYSRPFHTKNHQLYYFDRPIEDDEVIRVHTRE